MKAATLHPTSHNPANASTIIGADDYVRERMEPKITDLSCITLQDVKRFIENCAPQIEGAIFDYGCGGTPYKALFHRTTRYVGADMLPGPSVDVVLSPDGMTHQEDSSYSAVLSTQVLEHIGNPAAYLQECFRILKPGGTLILTTHGLFPEHKCPDDYFRWTSQGLQTLATSVGFQIEKSTKISCGVRGGIQLLHYIVDRSRCYPKSFIAYALRLFARVYRLALLPLLNFFGRRLFWSQGLLPAHSPETIYLGVGILARKPLG